MKEGIIRIENGRVEAPDRPVVLFIVGDGTGPDIWRAARPVFDAAVEKAYRGKRKIAWREVLAGEKAYRRTGSRLPAATISAVSKYGVAVKGPLTTPVAGGIRSLNVLLRRKFDLYACIRPVSHVPGAPSPVKNPGRLDVVIFRENTEDVYAGIEWKQGSPGARKAVEFLNSMGSSVRPDSGIGVKPVSREASQRLVRAAILYALKNRRKVVTLVHKGNIMKFTEGAFRDWGYEVARREFGDVTIAESELRGNRAGVVPDGMILLNDRIADSMFQQVLLRPEEYDVIATTNLNGDYLSDACAAQVGGLGMVPGANVGDTAAIFEAVHGTATKYAGKDMVNPSSLILSGAMMFDFIGWNEAARAIRAALARTVRNRTVTYDLHRQMKNATLLKCSVFGREIIKNMTSSASTLNYRLGTIGSTQ
ncbi:MAG: isocitrate dehydrogenase (NADP(+)) [bacterium]